MNRSIYALTLILSSGCGLFAQIDVLTANYDNNRTNSNLNEGILNLNNVNPTQFGKLYTYTVDGQVYAQPLYVHSLNLPDKGTHNVLYVATMHNSVYAFDADKAGDPLWQVNLGTSVDPEFFNVAGAAPYKDILHEIGILSTPVIDRTSNTIYIVAETMTDAGPLFTLHALDLFNGSEKLNGPVKMAFSVPGNGWAGTGDGVDGVLKFNATLHLQRPGLLLANGSIYAGFGSHGDYTPWHGWIVAYSATDLQQQTAVFNTTPNTAGAAIWQGGRGLVADANGDVYCSTGNGNYDGVESWGETVLRLTPTLDVLDWFTPADYAGWTDDDLDYGSSGPLLVPGTNLLIAGGKAGLVTVSDRTNMGRQLDADDGAVQTFQAVPLHMLGMFNIALWARPQDPVLYTWGFHDSLRAFQMQNGLFQTTPLAINSTTVNSLPFSGMTVSSNATVPGSGILWATTIDPGDLPGPGALHAFNALDVNQEVWNSDMQGSRDTLGSFSKFVNPTVVNGKVYTPTDSNQVAVYGLLAVPGIGAVVNGASFSAFTVAPGELISIFGMAVGPVDPLQLALDSDGKVSTLREGYSVTFDGIRAPLLYVSAGQINAVVPFSITGRSTTLIEVATPEGTRYQATLPVSDAAPAVFMVGNAQGAILNSDYSLNSPANAAAQGSYVSIYATGTGVLSPAVADGTVTGSDKPPLSAAPVAVTIGGKTATVLYQGAAPGLVAGVMQLNVVVPTGVTPGPAVPVTITAGTTAGLNTVTLAVK